MTADFTSVNDPAQTTWDSESRKSPYSTVIGRDELAGAAGTYCEGCDQDIVADPTSADGLRCGCDAGAAPLEVGLVMTGETFTWNGADYRVTGRQDGRVVTTKIAAGTTHLFNPTMTALLA